MSEAICGVRRNYKDPDIASLIRATLAIGCYRRTGTALDVLCYSKLCCTTLRHSHSIVPGGFDVTSYTTRLTPLTSLMMRVAVSPKNFMSKG